ncbi:hypothetical protein [Mycobacterium sp. 1164985.4]|uniref:hypothetical protein n=1 Tax=Mycobacterium sp. 1164985.4 TaxID=1834069 RepID=UPI000800C915|nr:hypothetical protein [Mycobacterium sp. 1164985.4]OBK73131.1 hypothetical protein A5650_21840 [Mycobacterium sp. 1164985.4]
MKNAAWSTIALTCLLTSCIDNSEGTPIAEEAVVSDTTISVSTAPPSSTTSPAAEADTEQPGIVSTTASPSPAGSACDMPDPPYEEASVSDPAAPKITVVLPAGWSTTQGEGDVGLRLAGPDGMSASVTIAKTTLPPAEAFDRYADEAMAASDISTLSVLPAELCGFSGQKLLGSWADSPEHAVEFGDRLAHIPTTSGEYLVAVHVEAPAQGADFDPLTSPLLGDFGIVIP